MITTEQHALNSDSHWIDRRRSALLLHVTSLPGSFHKGVIGAEARQLIDTIRASGFSVWQFLPLGPTHDHGSPYEALSTFAGNPELIDLRDCVTRGWLDAAALSDAMDATAHQHCRQLAAQQFWQQIDHDHALQQQLAAFEAEQRDWLDDFALFAALKQMHNNAAWWQWPTELREREPAALESVRQTHPDAIRQIVFEQFLFDQQWRALKAYANAQGVLLFGDLPIYVAHDSADVWSHRDYFTVNAEGLCDEVAGVPPDYFSQTGQRWGNPLYRWEVMQADQFRWWVARVRRQMMWMDMLRIDHFRALEAFWVIPGDRDDGIIGEWRKAPGAALLTALQQALGRLPLIAEDLGIITEEVTALRTAFHLPGMKILQFAFGGDADNPYLPENFGADAVVYTGTHDNDTTLGWFQSADAATRDHLLAYLRADPETMPWPLIECALASAALLAVIPMQDLLALGSEAKFNTPGTLDGNWSWRLDDLPTEHPCWPRARALNTRHQRM